MDSTQPTDIQNKAVNILIFFIILDNICMPGSTLYQALRYAEGMARLTFQVNFLIDFTYFATFPCMALRLVIYLKY